MYREAHAADVGPLPGEWIHDIGSQMGWDVAPIPTLEVGSYSHDTSSAGGTPTSTIQAAPSSRADWLAKRYPALGPRIRGQAREEAFLEAAPLMVAALTSGASLAGSAARGHHLVHEPVSCTEYSTR
jgi:hypothetical protein